MLPAKRNGHMKALILNPDRMEEVCMDYMGTAEVPNVAGLCVSLGSTPQYLRTVFEGLDEIDKEMISAEERLRRKESIQIVGQTLLQIEDKLLSSGLLGEYNSHMTKFVLSAYHNRNEKTLHESKSDNTLSIHIASHSPIDLEELKEYQRLESAMAEQTKLELISMGRMNDENEQDGVDDIVGEMYEQHEPTTEEDPWQI